MEALGAGILSPEFVFDKLVSIIVLLESLFGFEIGESCDA